MEIKDTEDALTLEYVKDLDEVKRFSKLTVLTHSNKVAMQILCAKYDIPLDLAEERLNEVLQKLNSEILQRLERWKFAIIERERFMRSDKKTRESVEKSDPMPDRLRK